MSDFKFHKYRIHMLKHTNSLYTQNIKRVIDKLTQHWKIKLNMRNRVDRLIIKSVEELCKIGGVKKIILAVDERFWLARKRGLISQMSWWNNVTSGIPQGLVLA
ncbi:hypothetical protein OTU49_002128, partial [Cherax quadricarinatus]